MTKEIQELLIKYQWGSLTLKVGVQIRALYEVKKQLPIYLD